MIPHWLPTHKHHQLWLLDWRIKPGRGYHYRVSVVVVGILTGTLILIYIQITNIEANIRKVFVVLNDLYLYSARQHIFLCSDTDLRAVRNAGALLFFFHLTWHHNSQRSSLLPYGEVASVFRLPNADSFWNYVCNLIESRVQGENIGTFLINDKSKCVLNAHWQHMVPEF